MAPDNAANGVGDVVVAAGRMVDAVAVGARDPPLQADDLGRWADHGEGKVMWPEFSNGSMSLLYNRPLAGHFRIQPTSRVNNLQPNSLRSRDRGLFQSEQGIFDKEQGTFARDGSILNFEHSQLGKGQLVEPPAERL
jgi:hypothetical protein